MACCGGGYTPPESVQYFMAKDQVPASGFTQVHYTGSMAGNVAYTARGTGREYYAGKNSSGEYIIVADEDVKDLVALGLFEVVDQSAAQAAADQAAADAAAASDAAATSDKSSKSSKNELDKQS